MTGSTVRPLSILVTNITLSGRTGTEIVTRDLCTGLQERGHRPIVYNSAANADGPIASELRVKGIPVLTSIDQVPGDIEIIHAHHSPVAAVALCRFPDVPAIFVAHDYVAWQDSPPLFPSIQCYAAVDTTVAERLASEAGLQIDRVGLLLNAVDLNRFRSGPPLPSKPRRALAFAKNHGHVEEIRRACRSRGIELDVVGHAVGRVVDAPEALLGNYDLVFASALSALEAMACGRPVVVCDGRGLAGYVTMERAELWRPQNFGLRCLARRVEADAVLAEIDAYDPAESAAVSGCVRQSADRERWLDQVEAMHRDALAAHVRGDASAVALATARHVEKWSPRLGAHWPWIEERRALIEENQRLKQAGFAPVLGVRYAWNDAIAASLIAVLHGFGRTEDASGGFVADKAAAMIRLPALPVGHDLLITFEVTAIAQTGWPGPVVAIGINGRLAANWRFGRRQHGRTVALEVACPAAWLSVSDRAWLTMDIRNASVSWEGGRGGDPLSGGLRWSGVTFSATPRRSRLSRYLGRWARN